MTISVNQINVAANDSFTTHINITNLIANALNNNIVTTNSNTTSGNAAISGTFYSDQITINTLNGGNTSQLANLTISTNTTFSANAIFGKQTFFNDQVSLGANVVINLGNSSVRILTVNSSSNTLTTSKIGFSDHFDVSTNSISNNDVLSYSPSSDAWVNRQGFFPAVAGATNTSTLRFNSGNSTWYQTNTLIVYYANGTQAFP